MLIYHIGSPLFYKTFYENLLCGKNFGDTMINKTIGLSQVDAFSRGARTRSSSSDAIARCA